MRPATVRTGVVDHHGEDLLGIGRADEGLLIGLKNQRPAEQPDAPLVTGPLVKVEAGRQARPAMNDLFTCDLHADQNRSSDQARQNQPGGLHPRKVRRPHYRLGIGITINRIDRPDPHPPDRGAPEDQPRQNHAAGMGGQAVPTERTKHEPLQVRKPDRNRDDRRRRFDQHDPPQPRPRR